MFIALTIKKPSGSVEARCSYMSLLNEAKRRQELEAIDMTSLTGRKPPSIKLGLQHSSIISDRLSLADTLIGIVNPAPK